MDTRKIDTVLIRVLFVCTGNICRSPTAEVVFNSQAADRGLGHALGAASAGITNYHQGEPADPRSIAAAQRRGYDMSQQRARHIDTHDFTTFNYIVALDNSHLQHLKQFRARLESGPQYARIVKLMDYAAPQTLPEGGTTDVPDPYYGGPFGFDLVLDLVEAGCAGLIDHIMSHKEKRAHYHDFNNERAS